MWGRSDIRTGQRFVKASGFDREVWVVAELVERPGCPRHVRLAKEGRRGENLTVAAVALSDRRLFRSVGATGPTPIN